MPTQLPLCINTGKQAKLYRFCIFNIILSFVTVCFKFKQTEVQSSPQHGFAIYHRVYVIQFATNNVDTTKLITVKWRKYCYLDCMQYIHVFLVMLHDLQLNWPCLGWQQLHAAQIFLPGKLLAVVSNFSCQTYFSHYFILSSQCNHSSMQRDQ